MLQTTPDQLMLSCILVFLGAGIGGTLRYGVNLAVSRFLNPAFPVATLAVNIAGSFLMGLLIGFLALKEPQGQHWRLFLATGLLGGFTTFSSFSLDAVNLLQQHKVSDALIYILMSVVVSICALAAGLVLARQSV